MQDHHIIFNPHPKIQRVEFPNGQSCFIVDDALANPEALQKLAVEQPKSFQPAPTNAYPGIEFMMGKDVTDPTSDFFMQHIRPLTDARRTLHTKCRLSMVTLPPAQLSAPQWICHRDTRGIRPEDCVVASVLFLFHDETLGGTSFYAPTKSTVETELLIRDSCFTSDEAFGRKYAIQRGYFKESNEFFEKLYTAPAKWNRMVFYDGGIFHSGDIRHPEKMSANPLTGRLTLNGFFTCSRKAD